MLFKMSTPVNFCGCSGIYNLSVITFIVESQLLLYNHYANNMVEV